MKHFKLEFFYAKYRTAWSKNDITKSCYIFFDSVYFIYSFFRTVTMDILFGENDKIKKRGEKIRTFVSIELRPTNPDIGMLIATQKNVKHFILFVTTVKS